MNVHAAVALLILLAVGVAGCLQSAAPVALPHVSVEPVSAPWTVVLVDSARRAFEPGVAVGPDGTWYICALKGFPNGTNIWVSRDHGASFHFVGDDLPKGTLRSGLGDVGGGDCDLGTDAHGRVYMVDLWVGSSSVITSSDQGATWTGVPVSQLAAPMDRPWIVGGDSGEVLVQGAEFKSGDIDTRTLPGIWVSRSTDAGHTFPQQVLVVKSGQLMMNGNIARGGDGSLYVMYTKKVGEGLAALTVSASRDHGLTWTPHEVARLGFPPRACDPITEFPIVAADAQGGVYAAWVLQAPDTKRSDLYFASSPDHGLHWNPAVRVTDRPGARAFPWLATGQGAVGVAWYETNTSTIMDYTPDALGTAGLTCTWSHAENASWFVHYAGITNASSPTPSIHEELVQAAPVHVGALDRPYAERMGLAFDAQGRAGVVYVADVPEGKARPMFALREATNIAPVVYVHDARESSVAITKVTSALPAIS